jgi:hypothetical protein
MTHRDVCATAKATETWRRRHLISLPHELQRSYDPELASSSRSSQVIPLQFGLSRRHEWRLDRNPGKLDFSQFGYDATSGDQEWRI